MAWYEWLGVWAAVSVPLTLLSGFMLASANQEPDDEGPRAP